MTSIIHASRKMRVCCSVENVNVHDLNSHLQNFRWVGGLTSQSGNSAISKEDLPSSIWKLKQTFKIEPGWKIKKVPHLRWGVPLQIVKRVIFFLEQKSVLFLWTKFPRFQLTMEARPCHSFLVMIKIVKTSKHNLGQRKGRENFHTIHEDFVKFQIYLSFFWKNGQRMIKKCLLALNIFAWGHWDAIVRVNCKRVCH